jgi:hypothetical protein
MRPHLLQSHQDDQEQMIFSGTVQNACVFGTTLGFRTYQYNTNAELESPSLVEKAFALVVSNSPFQLVIYSSFLRLLAVIPFSSIAASAKIAPRLEIYTVLACSVQRPDIVFGHVLSDPSVFAGFHGHTGLRSFTDEAGVPRSFNTSICTSDPVVQATVAKMIAGLALFLSLQLLFYISFSHCHLLGRLKPSDYRLLGCSESTPHHAIFQD